MAEAGDGERAPAKVRWVRIYLYKLCGRHPRAYGAGTSGGVRGNTHAVISFKTGSYCPLREKSWPARQTSAGSGALSVGGAPHHGRPEDKPPTCSQTPGFRERSVGL